MVSTRLLVAALISAIFGLYCIKKKVCFAGLGLQGKSGRMFVFLIFFLLEQTLKRH